MGVAIHRTTVQIHRSVETSDYSEEEFILIEKGRDNSHYQKLVESKVPHKYWKVVDDHLEEMGPEEKAEVDAAELAACKNDRRMALVGSANAFLQSCYSLEQQQTISYMMDEAERQGLMERYAYFNQVGVWAMGILMHFYAQTQAIYAATTIEEVGAVSTDFSKFADTNPDVIIGVGYSIPK